jgi:hypothetical protein
VGVGVGVAVSVDVGVGVAVSVGVSVGVNVGVPYRGRGVPVAFRSAATVGTPMAKKKRLTPAMPRDRTILGKPSPATAFTQALKARLPGFIIGRAVAPIPELVT